MPIYEYHCEQCGKDFECLVFRDEMPECRHCQGKNVTRLMSACGFVSKSAGGGITRQSAGASSCSGCTSSSCASCGH